MGIFLSEQFLSQSKYREKPLNAGVLFDVVRLRYAYKNEEWWETCARQVEYSMSLYSGALIVEQRIPEAESFFDMMYNLQCLPSGRSMRIGGTEASVRFPESNFNCCFTHIESIDDICDVFHLSLCSCGVGFKITKELVDKLPRFDTDFKVSHEPYETLYPYIKKDATTYENTRYCDYTIYVGDSKEGWVEALRTFLELLQYGRDKFEHDPVEIMFNYNYVRPEGTPLQTWGGRAAGPEGLEQMFRKLETIIKHSGGRLKPIDCLDICNIIGKNVVVGGSRRAAEIALFDQDDQDCIEAKWGDKLGWFVFSDTEEKLPETYNWDRFKEDKYWGRIKWTANPASDHRTMSNNSMVFTQRPSREKLQEVMSIIQHNGEPGIFNLEAANLRAPRRSGLNPCAEILLNNKGVCNLSTVPWTSHMHYVEEYGVWAVNLFTLANAYRHAVRIGLRQTNVTLSLEKWDYTQKEDRLLGVSMTGVMHCLDRLNWSHEGPEYRNLLVSLRNIVNQEVDAYAKEMGVSRPLLVTTVKPEGSLTLLTTAGSCGVHRSYAPGFIRRMKFAEFEPICKALKQLGVPHEKDASKWDSNRWVFEFPVLSEATMAADDESIESQFARYIIQQTNWTDHNTSITLYVGNDEWEKLPGLLLEYWDQVIAVSFLAKGHKGVQMPYEARPVAEIEERLSTFPDLTGLGQLVKEIEAGQHEEYAILDDACAGGACPIV